MMQNVDRGRLRVEAVLTVLVLLAVSSLALANAPVDHANSDDPARMSVIEVRHGNHRFVDEESLSDWQFHAIEWYLSTFTFIIGACVGSFLNVVIYRLPLGMGLLKADSHCPVCKMPISMKDNVPIFGWLRLRGRCRECAVRISPRYMFVEAGTALIFLLLARAELFSGGTNLPGHEASRIQIWSLAAINTELIAVYLFHCFLASTLLCCVLIAADRNDLPKSLILPTLAVGLLFPFRFGSGLLLPEGTSAAASMEAVAGLLAGGALGAILGIAELSDRAGTGRQRSITIVLAVIGCYLGWDAAMFAAVVTGLAMLIVVLVADRFPAARRIPLTTFPAIASILQIPFWRDLSVSPWWPRFGENSLLLISVVFVLLLVAAVVRKMRLGDEELKYGAVS